MTFQHTQYNTSINFACPFACLVASFRFTTLSHLVARFIVKDLCLMIFKIYPMLIGILQRNFTVLNPKWKKNSSQRHQLLVAANVQSCGLVGKLQYLFVWFIVVWLLKLFGSENTSIPHCISFPSKCANRYHFEIFCNGFRF